MARSPLGRCWLSRPTNSTDQRTSSISPPRSTGAPSQLSYIDALLVRHHKRQPAHAKLEPSPPPVERCFVYSPLGLALVIAPSHDGVRRPRGSVTPAAAWEAQGTNSPPRNRWCDVRWLELWHVDKEAALSGAVFDCRAEHFTLTGDAAYSIPAYSPRQRVAKTDVMPASAGEVCLIVASLGRCEGVRGRGRSVC